MKKRLFRFTILILILLTFTTPVYAMDEPDSVNLSNIEVFHDLIKTDDFLAIAPYSVPFTTLPDDGIDETFIFSLLDEDGDELGSVTAYPYNDLGYGSGIVSFYLESGTTWESAYTFRVRENPAFYPSAQHWDFTIGPSNYSSASDQSDALRTKLITVSQALGTEWTVELLTSSEGVSYLSTYGESYFLNAIPGLATMCPRIFYTQVRSPDYSTRSWDYSFANTLATRYDDTFIENFMTGFAGLFTVNTSAAMNVASMIMFVILILIATKYFKGTTYSAILDGYALLLLLMLNGMISMIIVGFIAFLGIMAGGVVLLLNRS